MLVLTLLLSVGAVTWLVAAPGDDEPYRAKPPAAPTASADPVAADDALRRLGEAIDAGDRGAAAALASPDDTAAAALLEALAGNAAAARISEVSFRYVDDLGPLRADGTWWAAVEATWRYHGFDPTAARTEVAVRFRAGADDGATSVVDVGNADLRTPVWMDGPVQVRRTATTLVVAAAGVPVARYARLAENAVPVVRRVLADWQPRLVVEVPASATALDRALDAESGDYAGIAAVTVAGDGSSVPGAPVHVFVNPEVLRPAARRRGAGGDEPRGGARGLRGAEQPGAGVAGRGLRRLRGAARRRPAAGRDGAAGGGRGAALRAADGAADPCGVRPAPLPPRRDLRDGVAALPGAGGAVERGRAGRPLRRPQRGRRPRTRRCGRGSTGPSATC